jgi:hypothetical protein
MLALIYLHIDDLEGDYAPGYSDRLTGLGMVWTPSFMFTRGLRTSVTTRAVNRDRVIDTSTWAIHRSTEPVKASHSSVSTLAMFRLSASRRTVYGRHIERHAV